MVTVITFRYDLPLVNGEVQIEQYTIPPSKMPKTKCDKCRGGKSGNLVKHGCWKCGSPDWKQFQPIQLSLEGFVENKDLKEG